MSVHLLSRHAGPYPPAIHTHHLAFRVRVYANPAVSTTTPRPISSPNTQFGANPLLPCLAHADADPLPLVLDHTVSWQSPLDHPPDVMNHEPRLLVTTHDQFLAQLCPHTRVRMQRSASTYMSIDLLVPVTSCSPSPVLLARLCLSPMGVLSCTPSLGVVHPIIDAGPGGRTLPWAVRIDLHVPILPQPDVLDTVRLSLTALKQSYLHAPVPPMLHLGPLDFRHARRVYITGSLDTVSIALSESHLPVYASHVVVQWHVNLPDGWSLDPLVHSGMADNVLSGCGCRIRLYPCSFWVWFMWWRWIGVMLGLFGWYWCTAGKDLAVGVPMELVLLQKPNATSMPSLTINVYCESGINHPIMKKNEGHGKLHLSTEKLPPRYLLGSVITEMPTDPDQLLHQRINLHRPVLPPPTRTMEAMFGTPVLPDWPPTRIASGNNNNDGNRPRWSTIFAGYIHASWSVASQICRSSPIIDSNPIQRGPLMVPPSPSNEQQQGASLVTDLVHNAVMRARMRLASIRAAAAGPSVTSGTPSPSLSPSMPMAGNRRLSTPS